MQWEQSLNPRSIIKCMNLNLLRHSNKLQVHTHYVGLAGHVIFLRDMDFSLKMMSLLATRRQCKTLTLRDGLKP